MWRTLLNSLKDVSSSNSNCRTWASESSSDADILLRVWSHSVTLRLPSKSLGNILRRFMVSTRSRRSGWSSSIAFMSRRSLSISVIKSDTISAMHLEVLPLSSFIVIGLSSLILSNAAGQSSLKARAKASMVGNWSLWTCKKKKTKHVNRDSHIASSPISQSSFFKGVRCLILASSQRKLRGYVEFFKFDVTIKKIKKSNSSKI